MGKYRHSFRAGTRGRSQTPRESHAVSVPQIAILAYNVIRQVQHVTSTEIFFLV
jgi:hypothetical protein